MTFAFLIFVVCVSVTALSAAKIVWNRGGSTSTPLERWASVAVLGFAIAIAESWLLSWLNLLDRTPLIASSVAFAVLSVLLAQRTAARERGAAGAGRLPQILYLLPLFAWLGFVVWRGSILPVGSHDALAYHMPKAVMLARAHHYEFFVAPDPRIATSPSNYELLLADVLLLAGSDVLTSSLEPRRTSHSCWSPRRWQNAGGAEACT
jgi:hypothetical protein